jgi:hypothetical protein
VSSRLIGPSGRWHEYSLDGERVLSVTGVINKSTSKGGLAPAAAKETALWCATHASELRAAMSEAEWIEQAKGAHRRAWDRSRDDGTQVHSIAQRLIYGEPVETSDPTTGELYSDDVVRMGAQVARFMDVWGVSPDTSLVEQAAFHETLRYAGTFDLCGTLRDGQRWLIDYKTGASGVWPETALQLTAYSRCTHVRIGDRDMLMPPVDRCAALSVRPDRWELVPVKSDEVTWQAFVHAIDVARWAQLRRQDVIGAALPVPVG